MSTIRRLLISAALCLLGTAAAALLGLIAINVVPCSWFGSGFEGGCGLGAVIFFMSASAIAAVVLAVALNIIYFRRRSS